MTSLTRRMKSSTVPYSSPSATSMRQPIMSSHLVAEAAAPANSSVTRTMMTSVGGCVASPILLPCYAPHHDVKIENDNINNMSNTDNTILTLSSLPSSQTRRGSWADGNSHRDSCRDSPDGTLLLYRSSSEGGSQRQACRRSASVRSRKPC